MLEKIFDFKKVEAAIYKKWLPYLKTEKQPGKKEIVFLMAPPNITGVLHLGHALENTLVDILVRYYRMKGLRPVWLPGTDHASIATHYVVEKELRKQGLSRLQLGRPEFLKQVWAWREKYGNLILEQFKRLGITPDWSRVKFTLDPQYIDSVEKAFVKYYKKGLVYRDFRPINFCPRCHTGLSDLEIDWQNQRSSLYYIKYPLKHRLTRIKTRINTDQDKRESNVRDDPRDNPQQSAYLVVATTRPETMLGDAALAVNPSDERYESYIGQLVILPLVDRELPIIADTRVDPKFGSGALKITPAHSLVDFEISQRHSLPLIQVINEQGEMMQPFGLTEINNLDYLTAREKIVAKLQEQGLIEKIEPFEHEIPFCDRCKTELQVVPSVEWFVKMKGILANSALSAVKNKKVNIIPNRFKQPYLNWLKNIRDWCVSRKLWWGQQLPVWFCENQTGGNPKSQILNPKHQDENFIIVAQQPKKCPFCKKCKMERTQEVFDTWFSSALWPFATLYTKQEQKWYPAYLVSSGRDILHLWITRMIYSGLFFKNKPPFQTVLIHPTVLTKEGKRMSKSLGTGVDPLDLIEKYGADALRFGLIWQISGRQDSRFDETHVEAGKKFTNKLWNATRFFLIKYAGIINAKRKTQNAKHFSLADKKIIKSFNATRKFTEKKITQFEFSQALQRLYRFFWHDFCDVYLESCKGETQNNPLVLKSILENSLKLINPFMPFVTEVLWQEISSRQSLLLLQSWPNKL